MEFVFNSLPKFDKKAHTLSEWLYKLELRFILADVSDDKKKIKLCQIFIGQTGEYILGSLGGEATWEQAKAFLVSSLGEGTQAEEAWNALKNLTREGKDIIDLGWESEKLAKRAFPGQPETIERHAIDAFLQALDIPLAVEVQKLGYRRLADVVRAAKRIEKLQFQYPTPGLENLVLVMQDEIRALRKELEKIKALAAVNMVQTPRPKDFCPPRCYFCDEEDHLMANCTHKREWKQNKQRTPLSSPSPSPPPIGFLPSGYTHAPTDSKTSPPSFAPTPSTSPHPPSLPLLNPSPPPIQTPSPQSSPPVVCKEPLELKHTRSGRVSKPNTRYLFNITRDPVANHSFFRQDPDRPIVRFIAEGLDKRLCLDSYRQVNNFVPQLQDTKDLFALIAVRQRNGRPLSQGTLDLVRPWFPAGTTWHYQPQCDGWRPMSRGRDIFLGGRGCDTNFSNSRRPHSRPTTPPPLSTNQHRILRVVKTTEVKTTPPPIADPPAVAPSPCPGPFHIKDDPHSGSTLSHPRVGSSRRPAPDVASRSLDGRNRRPVPVSTPVSLPEYPTESPEVEKTRVPTLSATASAREQTFPQSKPGSRRPAPQPRARELPFIALRSGPYTRALVSASAQFRRHSPVPVCSTEILSSA